MQSMMLIIKYGGQLILKDVLTEKVAEGNTPNPHDFSTSSIAVLSVYIK